MSSVKDVGISPVLLQAISQSLTSTRQISTTASNMSDSKNRNLEMERDLVSQLIQQSQSSILPTNSGAASDTIKTMLKIKMAQNALSKSMASEEQSVKIESSILANSASDLAMANVLTAFATQNQGSLITSDIEPWQGVNSDVCVSVSTTENVDTQQENAMNEQQIYLKTAQNVAEVISPSQLHYDGNENEQQSRQMYTVIKSETQPNVSNFVQISSEPSVLPESKIHSNITDMTNAILTSPATQSISVTDNSIESSTSNVEIQGPSNDNSIVLNSDGQTILPSNSQTFIVSGGMGEQIIEHDGKRYTIQTTNIPSSDTRLVVMQTTAGNGAEGDTFSAISGQEGLGNYETTTIAVPVYTDPGAPGATGTPCPICSDHVSGFHYGIFTCESCKGFFKRTVQNKKTFLCHRQGECEITLENRKKCPACRFAKCLVMGMKLEAIRQDRTRGGRSSYTGLSPLDEAKRKRINMKIPKPRPSARNDSRLISALNHGESMGKPFVPSILIDIMNLESLLCDDDIPASISSEDFSLSDPNVFLTLLQLCELKLYKIVRWARNLPYFANISTDDQILLLQNCWCELLALTMCWKSIHLNNEILFFHGQTIDLEKATLLNLADMFNMLLGVVEQFKRIRLDQYECVAMKVLILICPDIKGLNDADKLGEQQAKVSGALDIYTQSHYPHSPNKFGELVLRLGELSRISGMLKDSLVSWMPPNTTSCGLLYELLKGDNMKALG